MDISCQYSKIVVPGDPAYAGIAGAYTGSVAEKLGFEKSAVEEIKQCTQRVVAWAIDYSLGENEKVSVEISCEVIPEGFRITVRDRGVPFEPSMLKDDDSKDLSGVFHLDGQMDEVIFNNMGPGGKEIVLVKYSKKGLITDFYNACELEVKATAPEPVPARNLDFTVRTMAPEEAIGVSKCVYRGYGNTYPHDHIYYPAKLAELNRNKSMLSAVAVTGQGEVIGHCALLYEDGDPGVAEMGLGVVKPEYRAMGCFNRLTAFLIEKAQADRMKGLYVRAVAAHKYSQQTAGRFGLKESALLLAYIPPTVIFKRVGKGHPQRVGAFLCYRYLTPPPRPLIYPPARHRRMIIDLYDHLGVRPIVKPPAGPEETVFEAESRIRVKVMNAMGMARVIIESYGKNIVSRISRSLTELCLNKIEVLNLYLDLSDPRTGSVSEKLEAFGFFFSGVLPGCMPNGSDGLVLQYLNNVPVDYHAVQAHSEMAKKLLVYISGREA